MIEVQIPQGIEEHEPKIIAGFTARQVVCLAIGILVFLLSWKGVGSVISGTSAKVCVCGVITCIPLAFGFIKIQGQPLEKMGVVYIKENLLAPTWRIKEYRHPELEVWEKDVYKNADEETKKRVAKMKAQNKGKKEEFHAKRSRNYKGIK